MGNLEAENKASRVEVRVDKVQLELDSSSQPRKEKGKDFWDKLGAVSTLLSGILVGLIGIYATSVYNARQLDSQRLQQEREISVRRVETVERFFTHLASDNQSIRGAALDTIAALGDEELAANLARHFGGEGSRSTLARLSRSQDPEIARTAELALSELFGSLRQSVGTFYQGEAGVSTAFFISSDDLALVPSFALGDGNTPYFIQLAASDEKHSAQLLKRNDNLWLALVKVNAPGTVIPIPKTAAKVAPGDQVAALGYTPDFKWLSVVGRILGETQESGQQRTIANLELRPGMAGAPVMNMRGELVGMAVASDGRGTSHLIPAEVIWRFVTSGN